MNITACDMTDPNALMKAIYHETTNFNQHTANEQTAKNRGDTGAGIFALKNFGNANTNTMDNGQWLSNHGNSDTINSGNLSLVSDVSNTANGNGTGNAFGELAIPLAGAGCAGTALGCPIGATAGAITGLALEAAIYTGLIAGTAYILKDENGKISLKDIEIDKAAIGSELELLGGSSSGFLNVEPEKTDNKKEEKKEESKNNNSNSSSKQTEIDKSTQEKIDKVKSEAERTKYQNNLKDYDGGKTYKNQNGKLPEGNYKEFDLNPSPKGTPRSSERIVIDKNTGKTYYTPDHYETFTEIP